MAKPAGRAKAEKGVPASPLGVFDSGVGGLTVLREIHVQLPNEDVIYLADTARVPFGSRSPQEIIQINREIIPFLLKEGAKMIIMACGTSSAIAYPVLKDEYPVEMINLIDPGAQAALAATKNGKIGLIATAATVNSGAYQEKIKALGPVVEVFAVSCPLFVPLVEGGHTESDEAKKVAKEYLKPLLAAGIDTLLLGCTHYPHLCKVLDSVTGGKVVFVDPAQAAVTEVKKLLKKAGTLKTGSAPAKYHYFVTSPVRQFEEAGSRLVGRPIVGTKQVSLI